MLQYIPDSVKANVYLLAKKMGMQVWREGLYNRWVKFGNRSGGSKFNGEFVEPVGQMQNLKYANVDTGVFTIYEDFQQGGTDMFLPIKQRKHGTFVYGDDTLQGKGQVTKWGYQTLYVNEVSDVIATKAGHYSEHVIKKYLSDIKNVQPELTERMGRYVNTLMVKNAIFNGKSYELTKATTAHGRGFAKASHPNMYIPGTGFVSYNLATNVYTNLPYTAGYETDVETGLNSLGNSSPYQFNKALIDKMAVLVPKRRIPPCITAGGNSYYLWVIGTAQFYQLQQDTAFMNFIQQSLPRETDPFTHWQIQGAIGAYNGFIFVLDQENWGAHTNTNPNGYVTAPTSGYPAYGPEDTVTAAGYWNPIFALDTSNYQMSVILGKGCVNIGIAKQLEFTDENWDHKRKSEIGNNWIAGAVRNDILDVDNQLGGGANSFIEYTGSIAVPTYSPTIS